MNSSWVMQELSTFLNVTENIKMKDLTFVVVNISDRFCYPDSLRDIDKNTVSLNNWEELQNKNPYIIAFDTSGSWHHLAETLSRVIYRRKRQKENESKRFILADSYLFSVQDFTLISFAEGASEEILSLFDKLRYPYTHWASFNGRHIDQQIVRLFVAAMDNIEETCVALKTATAEMMDFLKYRELIKGNMIFSAVHSGPPFSCLRKLSEEGNNLDELQGTYYYLRKPELNIHERDFLDLTMMLTAEVALRRWVGIASLREIVEALIKQERLSFL